MTYELRTCTVPKQYEHTRIPAQVVLVLDASGSMAGTIGNETKMQAAKREALAFMHALQDDVPVGLVVYGHKGDNTDAGREASCGGIEWVQELTTNTTQTDEKIRRLKPTGWTPLGATLAFLHAELSDLTATVRKHHGEQKHVPVVYVISDGEETCDGNPVEQARVLHESGVKAIINVVGFNVDDRVRAQLEAISEAGGGRYIIADDARELREELEAQSRSNLERSRYQGCIDANVSTILGAYNRAMIDVQGCVYDEAYRKSMDPVIDVMRKHHSNDTPEAACYSEVVDKAGAYYEAASEREDEIVETLRQEQQTKTEEASQYISE